MNCDSMGIYELLIGLEVFPEGAPVPLYKALLTVCAISNIKLVEVNKGRQASNTHNQIFKE